MRTTPVSPLVVDGQRYIVGGLSEADWVKNARTAGWAILSRGLRQERVRLVELPVEERARILREFPKKVPHGVWFFRQVYGLPEEKDALPEAFAALSSLCTVFRVEEEKMN